MDTDKRVKISEPLLFVCRSFGAVLVLFCVLNATGCGGRSTVSQSPVPLYDNLGNLHHPITTTSELAQQYFDQGLRLTYAFNHAEALNSFKQAIKKDPKCAMCYWGVALALGPNINVPMDASVEADAVRAVARARALSAGVSKSEQDYIFALSDRYSSAPGQGRARRDINYATAMRDLARTYPNDPDASTLYAEALMLLRPWDYWTREGHPQPGTLQAVTALEGVLRKQPEHPGACHLYIHLLEASRHPGQALSCARRLPGLMPGAGHLVHMPAHIYMQLGRYEKVVERSMQAVSVDKAYIEARQPGGIYPMLYVPHNYHVLWAALTMQGRSAEALKAADNVIANVSEESVQNIPTLEVFVPTRLFALARFGKWKELLDQSAPSSDFRYTTGVYHYVRGLAWLRTGKVNKAKKSLGKLNGIAANISPESKAGLNFSTTLLKIAANVLAGEIAAEEGTIDRAIRHFQDAIRFQDELTYEESPAWYYPVRQSLGAVLLDAGRAEEARAVYREDLTQNPENGWSLYGLAQSLRALGETDEVVTVQERFDSAWSKADLTLNASRF